jgi:hypothetical protein
MGSHAGCCKRIWRFKQGLSREKGMVFSFWQAAGILSGSVFMLVGTLWWTVAAFRRGFWWGLGCVLFLIPVGLVFAVLDWRLARWGVGLTILGTALMLPGLVEVASRWPEIIDQAREIEREIFTGF